MRKAAFAIALVCCSAVLLVGVAQADDLAIPRGSANPAASPAQAHKPEMPRRGMTMQRVRQRYGKPQRRMAPVGKPPITRWVYPGYIVYFEKQYVIQSVDTRTIHRP